MKYSIAGFKLDLLGEFNSYIDNMMQNYKSDFVSADMTVTYTVQDKIEFEHADGDIVGAGRFSWRVDEDSSIYAYTYSKTHNLYLALIRWNKEFNRADILAIDSCPLGGPSIDVKLFGLVGQAFYYMLMMHHAFVLHASAISYKGSAILFSAPSGTGKSTQTGMWKKFFNDDVIYINDDNPVLRVIANDVYVYGTPWAGKHSINNNIVSKLSAIICLEQADNIEISKLSGFDAFFRIYNETNKPVLEEMLNIFLEDFTLLMDKIKVYLMKCNLTEETVYKIKDLLELDY